MQVTSQDTTHRGYAARSIRYLNFHFSEEGRLINRFAKTLTKEQQEGVINAGKDLIAARSWRKAPQNVRNVAASLIVGQSFWYLVAPEVAKHYPQVAESPLSLFLFGGADKLFTFDPAHPWYTKGATQTQSEKLAHALPNTVLVGSALIGLELLCDFTKCWTEYWAQKKYGVIPDGLARAYGQDRPFLTRFSTLEVYQKVIGYVINPLSIGTAAQIKSSFQGIFGTLWRIGPQLAITAKAGPYIDKLLHWTSEKLRLSTIAKAWEDKYAKKEQNVLDRLKEILGEQNSAILSFQMGVESRTFWKWNPFKAGLSIEKARQLFKLSKRMESLEGTTTEESISSSKSSLELIVDIKVLRTTKAYRELESTQLNSSDLDSVTNYKRLLKETIAELGTSHHKAI